MSVTKLTTEIIKLTDAVVAAAEVGLTRGDVQTLLVAGRHDQARGLVAAVLRPGTFPDCITDDDHRRITAVVEVAKAADIAVVRALLV